MALFLSLLGILSLSRASIVGVFVIIAFASTILYLKFFKPQLEAKKYLLFGLLLPCGALAGPSTLLSCGFALLLSDSKKISFSKISWALPFLSILGCWAISQTAVQLPAWIFGLSRSLPDQWSFSFSSGLFLLDLWRNSDLIFLRSLACLERWVVLAGLFTLLWNQTQEKEWFQAGIIYGLIPALGLGLLQSFGFLWFIPIGQTSFWTEQGRFAASFTDPNACGIFLVLILPLLFRKSISQTKILAWALLAPLMYCGFATGTRSFLLGLLFYGFYFFLTKCNRRKLLLSAAALFACFALYILTPISSSLVQWTEAWGPKGLSRVFASIDPTNIEQTFFTRSIFLRVTWSSFLDTPVLGLGLENFRDVFPLYSRDLGLQTGTWRDNPNNFYLGILAELGILGFLSLILLALSLSLNDADSISRAPILCLAFLLLVGPHLDFEEVTLLASLLLALNCSPRTSAIPLRMLVLPLFLIGATITARVFFSEYGIYSLEREGDRDFRWIQPSAQLSLQCGIGGESKISIRALNADLATNPLQVNLSSGKERQSLTLVDTTEKEVHFSCRDNRDRTGSSHTRMRVFTESSRGIIPALSLNSEDKRILAVQVRSIN